MAEEVEIVDGPNDGERCSSGPVTLRLYARAVREREAGRAANNGALPPDLSLIVKARHGGADYIFRYFLDIAKPRPARPCFLVCTTTPTLLGCDWHARAAHGRAGRIPRRHAGDRLADGEMWPFSGLVAEPSTTSARRAGSGGSRRLGLAALVAGYTKRAAGRTSRRARSAPGFERVRPPPDVPRRTWRARHFPQVAVAASMARGRSTDLKLVCQSGDRDARGLCETRTVGRYARSLALFQLAVGDECERGGDGAEPRCSRRRGRAPWRLAMVV